MLLVSLNHKLIGLWIKGQKYYLGNLKEKMITKDDEEIFIKTKQWLDRYFQGKKPCIHELDIDPIGSDFQKHVWDLLCHIPYGEVTTYGSLAKEIAKITNQKRMSAQAIGGAVAHNPISIIIPCHRVVGTNGDLTGYALGIDKKIKLLRHEKVNIESLVNKK